MFFVNKTNLVTSLTKSLEDSSALLYIVSLLRFSGFYLLSHPNSLFGRLICFY